MPRCPVAHVARSASAAIVARISSSSDNNIIELHKPRGSPVSLTHHCSLVSVCPPPAVLCPEPRLLSALSPRSLTACLLHSPWSRARQPASERERAQHLPHLLRHPRHATTTTAPPTRATSQRTHSSSRSRPSKGSPSIIPPAPYTARHQHRTISGSPLPRIPLPCPFQTLPSTGSAIAITLPPPLPAPLSTPYLAC